MFRIPKHIGVIPDGNRRWAKSHGLNREEGYAYGLKPGLRLLRAARESGVKEFDILWIYCGQLQTPQRTGGSLFKSMYRCGKYD